MKGSKTILEWLSGPVLTGSCWFPLVPDIRLSSPTPSPIRLEKPLITWPGLGPGHAGYGARFQQNGWINMCSHHWGQKIEWTPASTSFFSIVMGWNPWDRSSLCCAEKGLHALFMQSFPHLRRVQWPLRGLIGIWSKSENLWPDMQGTYGGTPRFGL